MLNLDFNHIRPLNGSGNDGFEEFVCQLARREEIPCKKKFVRNGKPDGGVECYWILEDGSEVAWQAKYFCKAFGDSQYQQIDGSVKEALNAHSNLRRYIITVPTDLSDAHVEGRMSMRERIDGYVGRWLKVNPHVAFEFWWASDIIERLQKPSNQGMLRFWFGGYEFTDADLIRFNAKSIKDLGRRYLPKLNVDVAADEYFEVLSRGRSLGRFLAEELKQAVDVCRKIEKEKCCNEVLGLLDVVRNAIKQIKETSVTGIERIALDEFLSVLVLLAETVQDIANKIDDKEKPTEEEKRKAREIFDLGVDALHVYNDLHQEIMRLINDPILILEGDAGVGKSHLIADVVQRKEREKQISLLFLGQKFISDEDPFTQMMKMLYFNGSSEELLEMLEVKAETTGHRIIIFVDAINEGHGLTIWQNNIRSFIDKIRQHPWLGLVLSIRTSYCDAILPWEEFGYDFCVRARHYGFGINTQKAVKLYFKEYDILYPSVPLLNPEFKNPLFLYLFCEGMKNNGYRKIPDGVRGITSVMNLFFDGVENSLRKSKHYSMTIKAVKDAVRKYIESTTKEGRHEMPIENAVEIFSDICPRIFAEGELVDCLVSEGVFSKNVFRKTDGGYGECIYFTYERFENKLQAEYLIDEMQLDAKDLEEYVQAVKYPYRAGGLLESLAILLPERRGVELYDSLPAFHDNKAVVYAVLSSLIWRDEKTIGPHLDKYFTELVGDDQFRTRLIRTIMEVGFNPGNYFNADYFHKMLAPMKLADRDAVWVPTIYRIYGSRDNIIEEIVNWTWDESDDARMDERSVELGATLLSWFLASTNRKLRDTATKALVQLLHNRMQLVIPLLEKFSKVDDPYIHERLYAVALGCAVRSKSKEHLARLCQYIYSMVFNVEGDIYPHVLLRDYAREIIEYAIAIGEEVDVDVNRVRPPYHSSFNYKSVSDEEIRAIYDECREIKDSYGMYALLTSMFTEHTTVGFSYGDFGRYTFQSALSNWKIDAEDLSHIAIKLIMDKYGYREEKHGEFDRKVGSGRGRSTIPNERIGKKYQWLALHELMARVADNFPKIESPWSDNKVEYEGPWNPMVRDIDPTTLVRVEEYRDELDSYDDYWWYGRRYSNWEHELADWLNIDDDIPPVEPIIELRDPDESNWLALECYPDWEEPHGNNDIYKRLWYQVRSCIIDEEEFDSAYGWAAKQNFGGRWMPENRDRYELFYRDYYWSPAYQSFDVEGLTRREIYDRETNRLIAHVEVTSIGYLWEAEEDHSKETSFYSIIPSKQLFDGMRMRFDDKDGVFLNDEGKTVCFDAGAISPSKNYLLVRKEALLDYLHTHHKRIMWYVLGEKNIIGIHNYQSVPKLPMWLIVSGTYTLDENGKVVGTLRTCHEK
jgi:hypothetical protein